MLLFRCFLAVIISTIAVYTSVVIGEHGLGLFSVFLGDIAKMGWPGQFNLDFLGFLSLSAFWLAWRNEFSPAGLGLGLLGFFGGAPVLAAYLLFASISVGGDVPALLLGPSRAE